MLSALTRHWPEYLMEAAGLGAFMISACVFATILEYPRSSIHEVIADPTLRRFLMGLTMGLTAIGIIYSPWGKQSGAHINPSVTLTFFRLGKIEPWDGAFYVLAQFMGGVAGILIASLALNHWLADPHVNYVATIPGMQGPRLALLAEVVISFVLMGTVLVVSNTDRLAPYTGLFAGALVATYITFEAPLSGMSMNPARTLASTIPAGTWTFLWIYVLAPTLGMLLAAEMYLRIKGAQRVICAKLHHHNDKRCIFRCGYHKA